MSVTYNNFLPEIHTAFPDLPEVIVLNAIRNSCIEFCEQTLCLLYEQDAISLVAGENTYDFDLPPYTSLVSIVSAYYKDTALTAVNLNTIAALYPGDWRTVEGAPRYYLQLTRDALTVVPKPATAESQVLKLIVALKPTRDSYDVDDSIYDSYTDAVAYGARARLYDTPGHAYFNLDASLNYKKLFLCEVAKARIQFNTSNVRCGVRLIPARFV